MKKTILLFCLCILNTVAQAQCMMQPISLNQRVQNSDKIIEGKVIDKTCFRMPGSNLIMTSNLVEVYKEYKGFDNQPFVEVITEGGEMDGEILTVEPSLQLNAGDLGTFMLQKNTDTPHFKHAKTIYTAYAASQGFIRYNENGAASDIFSKYASSSEVDYAITKLTGKKYAELKQSQVAIPAFKSSGTAIAFISNFSPSSITAGTGSVLTINGIGFGMMQGTSFVEFKNADDGGVTFIKPHASQYLLWSDTQIQVIVPSVTTQSGTAGTGVISVNIGGIQNFSGATLVVNYALRNAYIATPNQIYPMQHADQNSGGYVFAYNNAFSTNTAAKAAFERALTTWRCATHINLQTSSTTSALSAAAQDGISLVTFQAGLPVGVLGQCYSYAASCGAGSTRWVFIKEIDLVFTPTPGTGTWQFGPAAPSPTEYDFETGVLHEMGHGHMLAHVIDVNDVMHYSGSAGQQNRNIGANDLNAGNAVMVLNQTSVCLQPVMIPLSPGNCTVGNSTGTASVSIVNTTNNACSGATLTFSASPVNGGAQPTYQWQVNGINAGTSSPTFTTSTLVNGDVITCIMTSDLIGVTNNPVTSNAITIQFGLPTISIAITAGANPTCPGSNVTFKATAFNGGTTPAYQWKFNGSNTGSNSSTLLVGGASTFTISCVLTSNLSCASPSVVTSNSVVVTVNPAGIPSVNIAMTTGTNPSCSGSTVTFSATPTFGGTTPAYQWHVNGVNAGTNNPSFSSTSFANNDVVDCTITSNAPCVLTNTATSSAITLTVNTTVAASVTESIVAGTNTICPGSSVTFTANAVNGGSGPFYDWYVNGVNMGIHTSSFVTSTLANNDIVHCTVISNANCANPAMASSNTTTMTVLPALDLTVTSTGPSLTANEVNATYQWVDCSNNYQPIIGETNQTFTATPSPTLYAVILDNGTCSDTSSCYIIQGTGINNKAESVLTVCPNPSTGKIVLTNAKGELTICEALGRKVFEELINSDSKELDLSNMPAGVYILKLTNDGKTQQVKIIKE